MATQNSGMQPGGSSGDIGRGSGRAKWVLLIVAVLLVAALVYALPMMRGYSKTGSAYAARIVCSCRYIGGRSLEDCQKDLEPGMEIVSLTEADNARRIDASVPLMAAESAELREGYGCVLMTDKEREALK